MSSMLEQALVDAAALKDAALKKAEAAVLESAAPKIREAVNALLEQDEPDGEEDLLDLGDDGGMGMPGPDMGPGEVGSMASEVPMGIQDGENLCPCPDNEEEIEIDFNELEKQMAADEQASEMGQTDLAQSLDLGDAGAADASPEDAALGMPDEDELELSEDTLFEILSEDEDVTETVDESEEISEGGDADVSGGIQEEALELKDQVDSDSDSKKDEGCGEEDSYLSHRINPNKVDENMITKIVASATKDLFKLQETLKSELSTQKDECKKLKKTILRLTEKMSDVNLSNALLVYENQVLKRDSLNERQKIKIVEAIQKAGSVKEAKVIYETLISSVGSGDVRRKPQSLGESVERRSTPLLPRRNKSETASNPNKGRMQKLAGII
jgi:hypothetical protein